MASSFQSGPQAFYLIAHGMNHLDEAEEALRQGANAIEFDVTAYEQDLGSLCVAHAGLLGNSPGPSSAPGLAEFLSELALRANARPELFNQLALVVLDCKPPAATPQHGVTIRDLVATTVVPLGLNAVVSNACAHFDGTYCPADASMFDLLADTTSPNMAFAIDETDNPDAVRAFFTAKGIERFGYANGSSVFDAGTKAYRTPIERAVWMRSAHTRPAFVYAWTVLSSDNQATYLRLGVDGMLVDTSRLQQCRQILAWPEFAGRYRLASRTDEPFSKVMPAYALEVTTSDVSGAGTDAIVAFELHGSAGSTRTTIDTKLTGRMERSDTNFLAMCCGDLGTLTALGVARTNAGNAPNWHLHKVSVASAAYQTTATATFDTWISGDFTVRPLVADTTAAAQTDWRWCNACQGLFYGPFGPTSTCPAGGAHANASVSGSASYAVTFGVASSAVWQSGWRWCNRCQGLFYGPRLASSVCAAGGRHGDPAVSHSADYALTTGALGTGQVEWRWCDRCQGLFYGPFQSTSRCPAGGQHSPPDVAGSASYSLAFLPA